MRYLGCFVAVVLAILCSLKADAQDLPETQQISNWPAPGFWSLTGKAMEKGEISPEAAETVPTAPLHFVGITPCRVADTRGNSFTGQYGPPVLTGAGRSMVITGQCGIPADAQAVSFNFSAVNVSAAGFFVAYPTGGAFPPVATMTYNQNTPNLSNAAIVPLGTGGAITVVAAVTNIDLVVDVNGYYQPGVVTAVNGLSGNVTLAAGSNVTVTPSGQTLTIASTGSLPAGSDNQTLRHDGSNWVASSALQNNGTDVSLLGNLNVESSFRIIRGGLQYLHGTGNNTFLGGGSGNFTATGNFNNAFGVFTLTALTSGSSNTVIGDNALSKNTSGSGNTAFGAASLVQNQSGVSNTAVGYFALNQTTGSYNIALGQSAGSANTSGFSNIYIGNSAGSAIMTGSNNIMIGNAGSANESGQIRIGTVAAITGGTVIVGISGFGSSGGIPVIVNPGGRLGTTTSSARFKEDVHNIDSESDGLLKLRPVAFRYKESHEPGRLQQYGLIAEEVAQIYPELVVNDAEGRPFAIRSQLLDPLLLKEVQKQRAEIEELKAQLARLEERLEADRSK